MARILVTGGAGFIGSHVGEALLLRGDSVLALDNLNTFYDPAKKRANAKALARHPGFRLVEGDIRDRELLVRLCREEKIDGIIHLAAMAGVRPSIEQPELYADVNLMGTQCVLDAARLASVARVVFASSSSVYGNREGGPFRESDRVDNPVSPYAATKKAGELMCHAFFHVTKIPVTCLRFFTVYGPRQRPDLAITKFADLLDQGKSLPFFGDGSTRRDYTYVTDITDGVLRALDRAEGYRIYNLGESATVTLLEMVEALGSAMGKTPVLDRQPEQLGDVRMTFADVSLARAELGYAPKVPFKDGIIRYVAWRRQGDA